MMPLGRPPQQSGCAAYCITREYSRAVDWRGSDGMRLEENHAHDASRLFKRALVELAAYPTVTKTGAAAGCVEYDTLDWSLAKNRPDWKNTNCFAYGSAIIIAGLETMQVGKFGEAD